MPRIPVIPWEPAKTAWRSGMRARWWPILAGMLLLTSRSASVVAEDPGFLLPAGFSCQVFAPDTLAHDVYTLTFSPRGEVVVAGPGYIRTLLDQDLDGIADSTRLFSEFPRSGAQGLCFVGNDLLCAGDDGLLLLTDADANGVADGPPRVLLRLKGGEHGVHAIVRGPDDWLYVACGNEAQVNAEQISSGQTRAPTAGCILRVSRDYHQVEVLADGFRNIYDLTFDSAGAAYVVDSDNERQQYLPWYAGCRLLQVRAGRNHGWLDQGWAKSWNRPDHWFDSAGRLADLGRGSPTGLLTYQGEMFPAPYQGALFSACWTTGLIYAFPVHNDAQADGAHAESLPAAPRYGPAAEIFLQSPPQTGFTPTDLAVGPAGDLWISTGGRDTPGGVYRVVYTQAKEQPSQPGHSDQALRQAKPSLIGGTGLIPLEDPIAWEIATLETHLNPSIALLSPAAGLRETRSLQRSLGDVGTPKNLDPLLYAGYGLARELTLSPQQQQQLAERMLHSWRRQQAAVVSPESRVEQEVLRRLQFEYARTLGMLLQANPSNPALGPQRAEALQLIGQKLRSSGNETMRLAAGSNVQTHGVEEALHYLLVQSLIPGPRQQADRAAVVNTLVVLPRWMETYQQEPSRDWPRFVTTLVQALVKQDPAMGSALVEHAEFGHSWHALYLPALEAELQPAAVSKLLAKLSEEAERPLPPDVLQALTQLPAEIALPLLRKCFDRLPRTPEVAMKFAEAGTEEDRERLLALLSTADLVAREACLTRLSQLQTPSPALLVDNTFQLLQAEPRGIGPQAEKTRSVILRILSDWHSLASPGETTNDPASEASTQIVNLEGRLATVRGLLVAQYPELAQAQVLRVDWPRRLEAANRLIGNVQQGAKAFQTRRCSDCHAQGGGLGPALRGTAKRLGRKALAEALFEPDRNIAADYRQTRVETASGQVWQGMMVYQSPEAILLLQATGQTVRISGEPVQSIQPLETSLMPSGLLDAASDQELADLIAYLETLE